MSEKFSSGTRKPEQTNKQIYVHLSILQSKVFFLNMCIDKEKTISTIDSTKNNAVLLTMNNHINK